MTTKTLDLFTEFRNKNIQEEKIREILTLAINKGEPISKIEKYGRNLLLTACLYDNDNVFKYLSNHYAEQFKEDFRQCVLLTYTNKNPNILKESFNHLAEQSPEQKNELIQKISKNCFREENIFIAQEWLTKNLDQEQTKQFVSQLIKNNNKPFLNCIKKIPHWNQFINNGTNYTSSVAYKPEPLIENIPIKNKKDECTELPIDDKTVDKKSLIIVKKKNRTSSLRNNL